MNIIKRNGVQVEFNPSKILTRIKKQSANLKVNADELFLKVTRGIADNMTTSEIDDLIAQTSAAMTQLHPDYSRLAGNVCVSRHHKETNEDLIKTMKELYYAGVIKEELLNKAKEYKTELYKVMNYEDDYSFDFFAWIRLRQMYLLKIDDRVVERPQHMYMRIALHLTDNVDDCIEYYKQLKDHKISPSTPVILNSGTQNGSLISCNLSSSKGDSRISLLETLDNICSASANAEGIGLSLHNIRSKDSYVGKRGGKAGGLLKWMKILNESLRFFDQNGQRPGSCAVYLEMWHRDLEDMLEIRKKTGDETLRARDMFTSLWIPDNFMRAVENKTDWYLFCPNDIVKAGLKPLYTIYGDEYEAEYQKAVDLGIGKKVNAQEIWMKILESQMETGMPYMCFKDNANKASNHQHLGTLTMSNLCLTPDTMVEIEFQKEYHKVNFKTLFDLFINHSGESIRIKSFDIETNTESYETVTAVNQTGISNDLYEITDEYNNTIRCTGDHLVFTQRGYVKAKDLVETDTLLNTNVPNYAD